MNRLLPRILRPLLVVVAVLLIAPFSAATSYADEVPFRVSYTGTLVPIPVDWNGDGTPATVLDGQSRGSFGASMSHIVSEWAMGTGTCKNQSHIWFDLVHSAAVVTFSNNDQLFGVNVGMAWMCMDPATGYFTGEARGTFTGGTGRFEGASGSFVSPFTGHALTLFTMGYNFGQIEGSIHGSLILQ